MYSFGIILENEPEAASNSCSPPAFMQASSVSERLHSSVIQTEQEKVQRCFDSLISICLLQTKSRNTVSNSIGQSLKREHTFNRNSTPTSNPSESIRVIRRKLRETQLPELISK